MMQMEKWTRWGLVLVALIVLVASLLAFIRVTETEAEQRQTLAQQQLNMLSDLTEHWLNEQVKQVNTWAQLTETQPISNTKLFSALLARKQLDGYYLTDRNGYVMNSQSAQWIGQASPITNHQKQFDKVLQGESQWILPYHYKAPSRDLSGNANINLIQLLIAAPLRAGAKVKGVLVVAINVQPQLYPLYRNLLTSNTAYFSVSNQRVEVMSLGQVQPVQSGQVHAHVQNKKLSLDFDLTYAAQPIASNLQLHHWLLLLTGGLSLMLICLLVTSSTVKSHRLPTSQLGRLMFEHSGEGLILLDQQGDVLSFNPLAQTLLAGDNEVGAVELTTLFLELSLQLKTGSGEHAPDFAQLIQQSNATAYFGLWAQGEQQRLLSCRFKPLDIQHQITLVQIKDVSVSRAEFIQLKRRSDALEQAAELVFWVKEDGGLIYANETSLQTLGYALDELKTLRLKDIDSAINEDNWHLLWSRVRRGETVQHEASLLRRSGLSFPADTHMSFYQDGYDAFVCIFARDISLRKRLEIDLHRNRVQLADKLSVTSQELQVREAENEALLESVPDLLLVLNARFELLHYQQPKGDPLNIKLQNGSSIFDLFPVLSNHDLTQFLLAPQKTVQARYFAEVTRATAQSLQILELRFARASTNRIMVMVRDITARKKEEFLRQFNNSLLTHISAIQTRFICAQDKKPDLNAQLNNLMHLAQADFGFYALTESLQQQMAEAAVCEQISVSESSLTSACRLRLREWGQICVNEWLHHERPLNPELMIVEDILPGYCNQEEDPLQKAGLLLLPVLSGVDLQMGFFILVADIRSWLAQVNLFEPWIATCATILAGYENDQERRWAEIGLKQEKERAEQANQAKTQFLSRMSHEFRTPLNAILGFGQLIMLDKDILSEEHYLEIEQIVNSGQEMLALVDEVLDLAKLERQELELKLDTVDIKQMLNDVLSEQIAFIEREQLQLRLDIVDESISIQADPTRLKQMLNCLLHNAIKFNRPEGMVSIGLRTDAKYCILTVEDTGQGMDTAFLEQLFSPFESAEGNIQAQGLGIGLALTKHIVDAMRGSIQVQSTLGVGSCFTVNIPLVNVIAATSPKSSASNQSPIAESQRFEVLYIEDDPSNQQLLERFFERKEQMASGLVLTLASSVEEGLSAFLEHCPDMMLVDMNLSGVSGAELLSVIRTQPNGDELPIIAVSGQVEPEAIELALEQGFDDYLCKPIDLGLLMSVITRYST